MLLNDFFTIITEKQSAEPDSYQVQIEYNEAHEIFAGHFPQMPVVPGVCIIQGIKELTEHFTNKKLVLSKGDNIKYKASIIPNKNKIVFVDLTIKPMESGNIHTNARFYFEETNFCLFKGEFKIL